MRILLAHFQPTIFNVKRQKSGKSPLDNLILHSGCGFIVDVYIYMYKYTCTLYTVARHLSELQLSEHVSQPNAGMRLISAKPHTYDGEKEKVCGANDRQRTADL